MKQLLPALFLLVIGTNAYAQTCDCKTPNNNLIVNGSFEDPATLATPPNFVGFESDYSATAPIGIFGIVKQTTDPYKLDTRWCEVKFSTGNFLFFDGANGLGLPQDASVAPYDLLRYKNIPVSQGQKYYFSYDATSANYAMVTDLNAAPFIVTKINGKQVMAEYVTEGCHRKWKKFQVCWIADSNVATITINAGVYSGSSGRDFAIDNVYFGTCPPTILNGDSTTLDTAFCYKDIDHPLLGLVPGGTFTGCGIVQRGNNWYFNPVLAMGSVTAFPYSCNITYTDPGGKSTTRAMTVYKSVTVDLGPDIYTCDGKYTLNAKANDTGLTYIWKPRSLSEASAISVSSFTNSDILVSVEAINGIAGCSAFDTINIYNKAITAKIIAKDTVCVDESVLFSADVEGAPTFNYQWQMGTSDTALSSYFTYEYDKEGNYVVYLKVDNGFCDVVISLPLVVKDFNIILTASSNELYRQEQLTLQTTANEPYSIISWQPAKLFADQQAFSQSIAVQATEVYKVVGQSAYGCIDSADVTVHTNDIVVVPDAFTPNGDGKNDYFKPIVSNKDVVSIEVFDIYDRWGRRVYTGSGNDLPGWDGRVNGTPADMGVYYYRLKADIGGGAEMKKGDVTLIR